MLQEIILALLQKYNIEAKQLSIEPYNAHIVHRKNKTYETIIEDKKKNSELILLIRESEITNLYIFTRYGLNTSFSSLIKFLSKQYKIIKLHYIVWVEKDAYSAQLNHNNDVLDPARGTNYYTIEYFFNKYFSKNEYLTFQKNYFQYTSNIREYFGIKFIESLNPNATYTFKDTLIKNLISFDYLSSLDLFETSSILSDSQKQIIDNQFHHSKYYNALIGSTNFAQSFKTSEWLYHSLYEEKGNIDLTVISMGYFKAIEQFLYQYLSFHTSEKDDKVRTIRNRSTQFNDNYLRRHGNSISLGDMTGFLRFVDNRDLLITDIDDETYSLIKQVLLEIKALRNGYFHKDNINVWDDVQKAREKAYAFFYIMLGAFHYREFELSILDIPSISKSNYYKLCEYLNLKINNNKTSDLEIPILYLNNTNNIYDFFIMKQDPEITYDVNGTPSFSGIYISRISEKNNAVYKITLDNLPETISLGKLCISQELPITFTPSGAEQTIFDKGIFLYNKGAESL